MAAVSGWLRLQYHDEWLVTALHSFGSGPDGVNPWAPLLDVRDTLYGTTSSGGAYGQGTLFKMSIGGKTKVLHSFGYGSDGGTPLAGLIDVRARCTVRRRRAARTAMERCSL